MSTIPPVKTTIEPWKRWAGTAISVVIALATALPYFLNGVHFDSAVTQQVLAQVGAVTLAVKGFLVTPAGQWVLGLVGLDSTAVAKITTDSASVGQEAAPVVESAVKAIQKPSLSAVENTLDQATADAPEVIASGKQVVADVKGVVGDVK